MRTAQEMYSVCVANGYGAGFNEKNSIKHFAVIEKNLQPDETVELVFIGLHNYRSVTKHDNNFAYAITNKRILMGQQKVIGANFQAVSLNNINDISFTSGMAFGVITIDTMKERFNVAINKESAAKVNTAIHETLDRIRSASQPQRAPQAPQEDVMTKMMQYKNMLNAGLITEADYEAAKRKLLGI